MSQTEWFRTDDFGHGVVRIQESGLGPLHAANLWLVRGRDRSLLVDTGVGVAPLRPLAERLTESPIACVLTHSHYDHMGGGWEFAQRLAHRAEAAILADPTPDATMWRGWLTDAAFRSLPDPGFSMAGYAVRPAAPSGLLAEGDVVDLGDRCLRVLHVPGHAPGLLALYDEEARTLFTSDALYQGRMFFDLPGSDRAAASESIARLAALSAATVHPGHGESFDGQVMRALARRTIERLGSGAAA